MTEDEPQNRALDGATDRRSCNPHVSPHATRHFSEAKAADTVGLTASELDRLRTTAAEHGTRSAALISLLVYSSGERVASSESSCSCRFTLASVSLRTAIADSSASV